ncbi:MAG: selenium-dependent molybdenum cofactor biosynthesis protein YqeB [Anaerolineales bacterium]|nr:selenium-dependent molybdenum cofactor biosynthesis protein YqeB [Anaerolineales bacterium]
MKPSIPSTSKIKIVLLRGGGDLASGVAFRLRRVGIKVVIAELPDPLAVRRRVSFSEAVYLGEARIEGLTARRVSQPEDIAALLAAGEIPVLVDPDCEIRLDPHFEVLAIVDARMTKRPVDNSLAADGFVIGLGPGFVAGNNCQAAIETNRGHYLGRVIWDGAPEPNTGVPGKIGERRYERVLRAPVGGVMENRFEIGAQVKAGQVITMVHGKEVKAPFDGVLRGLLRDGSRVVEGLKIGDLDPRMDPHYAHTVSEKSLAIGGGVLEALLTRPEMRAKLWT